MRRPPRLFKDEESNHGRGGQKGFGWKNSGGAGVTSDDGDGTLGKRKRQGGVTSDGGNGRSGK